MAMPSESSHHPRRSLGVETVREAVAVVAVVDDAA